jgi:hypothetical protein
MEGGDEPLTVHLTAFYSVLVVFLVVGSGLMSGLTLGLLSLDVMDLEVRACAAAAAAAAAVPAWAMARHVQKNRNEEILTSFHISCLVGRNP